MPLSSWLILRLMEPINQNSPSHGNSAGLKSERDPTVR